MPKEWNTDLESLPANEELYIDYKEAAQKTSIGTKFKTTPERLQQWIKLHKQKYNDNYGKHEKLHVIWEMQDKLLELLKIKKGNKNTLVVKFHLTTGVVLVQGEGHQKWTQTDFVTMKHSIEKNKSAALTDGDSNNTTEKRKTDEGDKHMQTPRRQYEDMSDDVLYRSVDTKLKQLHRVSPINIVERHMEESNSKVRRLEELVINLTDTLNESNDKDRIDEDKMITSNFKKEIEDLKLILSEVAKDVKHDTSELKEVVQNIKPLLENTIAQSILCVLQKELRTSRDDAPTRISEEFMKKTSSQMDDMKAELQTLRECVESFNKADKETNDDKSDTIRRLTSQSNEKDVEIIRLRGLLAVREQEIKDQKDIIHQKEKSIESKEEAIMKIKTDFEVCSKENDQLRNETRKTADTKYTGNVGTTTSTQSANPRNNDPDGVQGILLVDSIGKHVNENRLFGYRIPTRVERIGTATEAKARVKEWRSSSSVQHITLHVGLNDLREGKSKDEIQKTLEETIIEAADTYPNAKIAYSEMLHVGGEDNARINDDITIVNDHMRKWCMGNARFTYIHHSTLQQRDDMYEDMVHINRDSGTRQFVFDITRSLLGPRPPRPNVGTRRQPDYPRTGSQPQYADAVRGPQHTDRQNQDNVTKSVEASSDLTLEKLLKVFALNLIKA